METFAVAFPTSICTVTGTQQIDILIDTLGFASDGTNISFSTTYCFDSSLPASVNIANIKEAIVENAVILNNGVKLLTNNITLLLTVN